MKKTATVILGLALLMLGTLVIPVMAVSPKKIPVTVALLGNSPYQDVDIRINPGEVAHVKFNFDGQVALHLDGETIVFDYVDYFKSNDFTPDPDPTNNVAHKVGGIAQVKEIWTNAEETGTFEGLAIWKETMPMFYQFYSNTVLQGKGAYAGQTLLISGFFGLPPADNTYYGYLLIP